MKGFRAYCEDGSARITAKKGRGVPGSAASEVQRGGGDKSLGVVSYGAAVEPYTLCINERRRAKSAPVLATFCSANPPPPPARTHLPPDSIPSLPLSVSCLIASTLPRFLCPCLSDWPRLCLFFMGIFTCPDPILSPSTNPNGPTPPSTRFLKPFSAGLSLFFTSASKRLDLPLLLHLSPLSSCCVESSEVIPVFAFLFSGGSREKTSSVLIPSERIC